MAEMPEGLDPSGPVREHWYRDESPETTQGLKFLGSMQWGDSNYDFDLTGLWEHEPSGLLAVMDDSGCSCPSPFEDATVRELTWITRPHDFYEYVSENAATSEYRKGQFEYSGTSDEYYTLVKLVRAHFEGRVNKS